MGIKHRLGVLARERGEENEKRFLEAFTNPSSVFVPPTWWRSIRKANRQEDSKGIDVVLETDLGKIFFQIKSSRRGAIKHQHRRRKSHTIVVVINNTMEEKGIQREAIGKASNYRCELLQKRAATT